MDPIKPESFNHRSQLLSTGRKYHFVDQSPEGYDASKTVTLVLVHGFPDTWYGWRYTIPALVQQGYRVIAPDMLGYGQTDKPESADEYTTKKLSADLAALLDFLEIDKAVIIGHDWGSPVVGRFALWHPDRLIALALLAVPFFSPRDTYISLEKIVEHVPNYGYQLYFADKISNKEIANNLELFLSIAYRSGSQNGEEGQGFTAEGSLRQMILGQKEHKSSQPYLLTPEETKYYMEQLADMNGPLNYYRTHKSRFEEERDGNILTSPRPDLPVLTIIGDRDPTKNQPALESTRKAVPQTKIVILDGVGHWLMIEAKDAVIKELTEWLSDVLKGDSNSRL